jgi:PD-(D/E)XK nuclease superfamily
MADGLLVFGPAVSPLDTISPTRFVAMRQCALREMWAAARAPHLLPSFPAARLGTVIHRLLEDAGHGTFSSEGVVAVDRRWGELVADAERVMLDGWLERHFVPLSRSVADFEVRRIQTRARALELTGAVSAARARPVAAVRNAPDQLLGCEVPVSTQDGRVRGRIDAVVLESGAPVIRDYKSGAIFEPGAGNEHTLKDAYEIQMRMYAALYAATTGTWPAKLEVIPILGMPEPVSFDPLACNTLVEAARQALNTVNEEVRLEGSVGTIEGRLARPGPSVCAQCPFRPGCAPYRTARSVGENDPWPQDMWGVLKSIVPLGSDSLVMEIECAGLQIRIRGLGTKLRHPALGILEQGDNVAVFNARQTGSPTMFAESPFTVIYKVPEPSGRKAPRAKA